MLDCIFCGLRFVSQFNLRHEMCKAFAEHRTIHALPAGADASRLSMGFMPSDHIAQNVANTPSAICASHLWATNIFARRVANGEMPLLWRAIHRATLPNRNCHLQTGDR